MTAAGFPFAALVALDELKLALQLAAVDRRLSVLIRGDKGAGKTTAARGLADLLDSAPFINLPIGATEDRLLGGLDVEKALKGEPALKRGLLAQANGGVLYIDEVNLLPDHLADALLDAAASGRHVIEREGFSATQAADFVLIGSMNPEEGGLRPQLLDRFAFVVDVMTPTDPATRALVVQRRLAYDAAREDFSARWRDDGASLAAQIGDAKRRLAQVEVSNDIIVMVAQHVAEVFVRSLRADLAIVRGSRALAALTGAASVDQRHVETVLPLVLAHRRPAHTDRPRTPQADEPEPSRDPRDSPPIDRAAQERVFAPSAITAPRLMTRHESAALGTSTASPSAPRGITTSARPTPEPRELDARATLVHAAAHARAGGVTPDDLHERMRKPTGRVRYLFVVDSSGSHAAQDKMRLVKGAVAALLDRNRRRHDEVGIIACRGAAASVLAVPTSNAEDAMRALEYLPTGGRTPLAHALELAGSFVTDDTVAVIVTDGHANVPTKTDDGWADALDAARALRARTIVIDSESGRETTGRPKQLAEVMRAQYARLADLDQIAVLNALEARP